MHTKPLALNYLFLSSLSQSQQRQERSLKYYSLGNNNWNQFGNSRDFNFEGKGREWNDLSRYPKVSYPLCRDRNNSIESTNRFDQNNDTKSYELPYCATTVDGLLKGLYIEGTKERREERLLPPWLDLPLAIRGQQFAMDHLFTTGISYIFGLTMLLSIPQVSDVLIQTDNSATPDNAGKRYAATIVQVFLWMRKALSAEELKEDNWVLESIRNVRFIHRHAAKRVQLKQISNAINSTDWEDKLKSIPVNEDFWKAFQEDLEASNIPLGMRKMPQILTKGSEVPMSQFSFSLTQFAFLSLPFLRPKELFVERQATGDDFAAFSHLWAVLGYALGIQDEFNIALNPDIPSIRDYSEEILQKYFIPSLFNLNHGRRVLIGSLLEGSSQIITGADPETIIRQMLKRVLRIKTPQMDKRRNVLGLKYDLLLKGGEGPATLFPEWIPISSPLISLYHFKIGYQYFGQRYSSDESIARFCFHYQ